MCIRDRMQGARESSLSGGLDGSSVVDGKNVEGSSFYSGTCRAEDDENGDELRQFVEVEEGEFESPGQVVDVSTSDSVESDSEVEGDELDSPPVCEGEGED